MHKHRPEDFLSGNRTFTWNLRPGLPTDSYEFNLFNYGDGNPWFYTNPPLGYVGSYTLQSLPPGFSTNDYYVWNIWVYDELGGVGISCWARWVAFTNSGMVSLQVPSAELEELDGLELYMLPQVVSLDR